MEPITIDEIAFQYPTSGRTAWSQVALLAPLLVHCFQYPTSGRTAWSPVDNAMVAGALKPFSTLPRVELPGAICSIGFHSDFTSAFSTLPRVELPGAWYSRL